jgi:DNA-binding IclR family transcriptional regulator
MAEKVQSIERAAAVLRLLGDRSGEHGIVDIGRSLGLAKGTVHGIVRTLLAVGLVTQNPATGKYRLDTRFFELGRGWIDGNELRSYAMNWADALAARTGAAVFVATLDGRSVSIVHHVFRPDGSVQVLEVGERYPAHTCALGKVLLASEPGLAGTLTDADLDPSTRWTVTTVSALQAQLDRVRRQGWAAGVEERNTGEASIAAPIRDAGGLVAAGVGIRGALEQLCDGRRRPKAALTVRVRHTAAAISRELTSRRDPR